MATLSDFALIWIFLSAVPVGIFAIGLGGSMILSVPIFQMLLPEMTLGAIIGNIKFGSVLRNITALVPTRQHIDLRDSWPLIIALVIGGAVGAMGIATLSQAYVLPTLLLAFLTTESAPQLANLVDKKLYLFFGLLIALYGGVFGAGIFLLIMALMRLRLPVDEDIVTVRSTTILLELANIIAAVCVFYYANQIKWPIALSWAVGSLLGGYVGGMIIAKTGHSSPKTQKLLLRCVFALAIAIAIYKRM